jgi:hypothetical protein
MADAGKRKGRAVRGPLVAASAGEDSGVRQDGRSKTVDQGARERRR